MTKDAVKQQDGDLIERLTDDEQFALSAASQAFCNRGIDISCPWDGDLDDEERERFDAMVAGIKAYNESLSRSQASVGAVSDDAIEAALHASVPGGAEVWHWLPQDDVGKPHATARNIIHAALATALRASPAMGEWRDISTLSEQDGIVLATDGTERQMWSLKDANDPEVARVRRWVGDAFEPTLWMPLPDLPVQP